MADCIVDACCLINLCASGVLAEVIQAHDGDVFVSTEVRREALAVYQPTSDDEQEVILTPIDLTDSIRSHTLHECRLEGAAEVQSFIQFAMSLDDGEASCLAIAQSRGWHVATDDKKASRFANQAGIQVVSSPQLLKVWTDSGAADLTDVAEALRRIGRFARFRPSRSDPLLHWWLGLTKPS